MKFNEIPAEILSLRMTQPYGEVALQEKPVTRISQSVSHAGSYEIYAGCDLIIAAPVDKRQASHLDWELASGSAYLARIVDVDVNNGFSLEVAFFSRSMLEFGTQDIGVDDYVVEQMNQIWNVRGRRNALDQAFLARFSQEFLYQQGDDCYFFMFAGASIEDEVKQNSCFSSGVGQGSARARACQREAEGEEDGSNGDIPNEDLPNEDLPEAHKDLTFSREGTFCVASNEVSFVATEKLISRGNSIYVATRLHRRKNGEDKAIRLAHGTLRFVDWSLAGQVQLLAKSQLAEIVQENSSYLKTWDTFGNIEGEILLREAREFGVISYCNAEENRDGTCRVTITDCTSAAEAELSAKRIEGLEYVETLPSYITDKTLTFDEFSSQLAASLDDQTESGKSSDYYSAYYKVLNYDESSRQITFDVMHLPSAGKIVLSLQGDMTQMRRRNRARKAILEGRSANPQLGLLLEENGLVTSLRLPKKVVPLTAFVRNKVFKNAPTFMQEKAIEVALNTPDIALIQGPPGTGKTTVIAAIVERLNQESTKHGAQAKGQVLLTGFQHDAVENMIDRISLNAIPVPKIGNRLDAAEDEVSAYERNLNEWCQSIVDGIHEKYPELESASQYKEIDLLAAQYEMVPTQALAETLMRKISEIPVAVIGAELSLQVNGLAAKLSARSRVSGEGGAHYARVVRLLRTTEAGFLDDGPERASDALDILEDQLSSKEQKLLRDASNWQVSQGIPPFMDDLRHMKESLLKRYSAPPVFRVEKENQEVIDILLKYKKKVNAASMSNKDKRLAALSEFVAELENDDAAISEAISEYSFAFASTCQQSVGKEMQRLKGVRKSDESSRLVYDYVIVDEAARVSPRDLMIPMSQGKRIILVGDHRQLPHIIDEEVARQMEEDGADVNEVAWLKKSMFEYLFTERLKALEQQDGITRRVTLDTQFRMHPLLGDFISRNFYERFNPEEKIMSGLPASAFAHNLPHTNNKPVAWLEVPASLGTHSRVGTSWARQAEIDAVVSRLFEWMNSEEGKNLTFGVISFYKAQADLIGAALRKLGVDESRVRVGTVDSFQGREFDVVFLSMVRTLPLGYKGAAFESNLAVGVAQQPSQAQPSQAQPSQQQPSQAQPSRVSPSLFGAIRDALFGGAQKEKRRADEETAGVDGAVVSSSALAAKNATAWVEVDPKEQREAQRLFGHLCLYNRLNVSMSRQKKLLVVAGDSALLGIDLANKFIPGLVDFYRLCEEEGVILPCQQ